MSRSLPRPPYVTVAAVAIIALAIDWIVRGLYYANLFYHEVDPKRLLVPIVALPVAMSACGVFLLRGHAWARFAWWIAVAPFWIWCSTADFTSTRLALVVPLAVLLSLLLAPPGAHWYFTGRDYKQRVRSGRSRRRIVHLAGPQKSQRSGDFKY